MPSYPPPILVAALVLLLTRALVFLSSYAAYLRWRAQRTLKALLCATGLGRAESDAMPDPADDEPEVEDVESVSAGLLPPATFVHDYERVVELLNVWRREESDDDEEDSDRLDEDDERSDLEDDVVDADTRAAPASVSDATRSSQVPGRESRNFRKRLSKLPAGFSNSGNTCFAAAALQCLYQTRLLTAHFVEHPHDEANCFEKSKSRGKAGAHAGFCVACEYQDLVIRSLRAKPASRHGIGKLTTSIGKIAKHFVRGRQEDSHEYIRSLLDALHVGWLKEHSGERAEKLLDSRTQETTMIYHVFGGYTCGRVVCGSCGHESRAYQSALDFPVEVAAGRGQAVSSVAAAMKRNFVDTETLDGANKYKCGGCHRYVKAERGSKIHVSPNVLVIPVKRYQLGRAGKITKFVEYPAELDLSPYVAEDAPYEGGTRPVYDLFGIVVHLDFMGSAHSGHYVAYVKLRGRRGDWCACDDGAVERVDEATALKQKAYLLFYERRTPRAAAPVRTPSQHFRKELLERLDRERTARIVAKTTTKASRRAVHTAGTAGTDAFVVPEYRVEEVFKTRRRESSSSSSSGSSSSSDSDGFAGDAPSRGSLLPSPWPAKVTVTVQLPTVTSAKQLRVEMTDSTVSVSVKASHRRVAGDARLELATPFPVDDDDAGVVFDSRAKTLVIVAPVKRYSRALSARHAAFLARRRAKEAGDPETDGAEPPSSLGSRRAESDGEDEDAIQESGGEECVAGLREDMGMMGLATSPATCAASRRTAASTA